jgi:KaiC/GvpD/RAD55 family RecA-like ATPase
MTNRDQRVEMLLGAALNDKALFAELVSRFRGEVFGRDEYDLAVRVLQGYYEEFGRVPSAGDLEVWADPKDLAKLPPMEELFRDPGVDPGTARRALYASYQKRATIALVADVENKIEARAFDVKETFAAMKEMVVRTSEPDRTFMMLTAENAASEYLAARDWRLSGTSPLCLKGITKAAAGGIAQRELLIFVAPPNRGKTTYLENEMHQGMLNGEKVLYLSMENEKESIISRLDDRILLMPKYEQRRRSDECAAWITKFHRMVPEPAIMYKAAGTYSVQDLDVWLEEQELKTGTRFDRVIVDYIDKFKKVKMSRTSDEWDDVRRLSDDLRALAIARDLRIITAAQTNRSGIVNREGGQTETVHEGMMAGGFGKFETADIVLGYSETPAEKLRGTGRVGVLKMRDSGGRGREFVVNMAPWIGLMTDRAEEVLPPEKQALLENPDRAYGDLKGLEVKGPGPKKGKGAPKVADVSGAGKSDGPAKSDGGVNI